jgi:F-type H+-transporting ATPase subunit b
MTVTLLAAGGLLEDLGINPVVLAIQAGLFVITFFALKRLLFDPIVKHMMDREADARRQTDGIRHAREELQRLQSEYAAKIAAIEKEAYDRLQAVLKQALEERARIVGEAQQRAAEETRRALAAIEEEKRAAMGAIRGQVSALARQAAQRILGVPVDPKALEAAAARAEREP